MQQGLSSSEGTKPAKIRRLVQLTSAILNKEQTAISQNITNLNPREGLQK